MNRVGTFLMLSASAFALTAGLAAPASAQTEEPAASTLEEVVVTARRREERLQEVPIAVVALSQQALDEQGVRNPNDLSRVAPGLSIQNTASNRSDTTFSIRGQGQTFGQNSPGVVAYFNEVPDFGTAIFDLENVQVLKGPQGTLFGRNTTGGAILFSPRKPTNDFTGYVVGRLGNYERRDLEFGVGGPIIEDKLLFRIAGQSLNREGFTTNVIDGAKLDNEDRQSWRATLVFRPFEGFENTLLYQDAQIDEAGSGPSLAAIVQSTSNSSLFPAMQADLARQRALGPRTVLGNYLPHYVIRDNTGWINTTSWSLNDIVTLKNIYSERRFTGGQSYDLDATNQTLLHVQNPPGRKSKMWTEEFQVALDFGAVSGVVGYYTEEVKSPRNIGFTIVQNSFGTPLTIQTLGQSENSSRAFYGQADWKATEQLTLTAGVRQTKDERSSGPQDTLLLLPAPFPPQSLGSSGVTNGKFDATTWNLAANFAFSPDLNLYGTIRKGYKAGGFNGTALNPADRFFAPEEVTDYEIGLKGRRDFGDVRTRFAIDAFYDDYSNIQRFVNLNTVPAQTVTRNAASGSIKGIDVDLTVAPSQLFDVSLNYTYLKAEYDSYVDPVQGDLSASRFPNTPEHQVTVTPRVNLPIPERMGSLSALASVYYQSSIATDPANVPNGNLAVFQSSLGANVKGYTRVDLRTDWRNIYESPVSAAAYVRNVFDEEFVVGTNNQLNAATGTVANLYGEPRFFGLELRYEFGAR